MITREDILKGTNGGLDIIFHFYPQAREIHGTNKLFKIRSADDTPSVGLKEFNGEWKITDFGDDGKAISAIDICMREMDIKSSEAFHFLADYFGITGEVITPKIHRPEFRTTNATEDEKDGDFKFELKEKMSSRELSILGPKVEQNHCDLLHYSAVKSYSRTKEGKTKIKYSTDNYPIFVRECKYEVTGGKAASFFKFYEPMNADKKWRFFSHGTKPANYIHGLLELKQAYAKYKVEQERWEENIKKLEEGKPIKYKKLEEAIICSGERDALCLKALGYFPIWKNSESDQLTEQGYKEIAYCVDRIYNIPDIDDPGVTNGMRMAMKFIDIYTVWLPDRLKGFKDQRGKPRKDFRDFCEIWPEKNNFRNLLNMARPVQFWESVFNNKGQKRLEINSDYVTYFLRCNGFVSLENKNAKTGRIYVRLQNGVVQEVNASDVKDSLIEFVANRYEPVEIRNLVNDSARVTESNIRLNKVELNFEDYTPDSQFFFFPNAVWEVTADNIKEFKYENIKRCVWDEELIKHKVNRLESSFKIFLQDESGNPEFDIKINEDSSSNFMRYLINSSRIYWRNELEKDGKFPDGLTLAEYKEKYKFSIDGPRLTKKEIAEQKQHLINKIFSMGYLLHRYKAKTRAWCVYAIDGKVDETGKSNGGSGKSFFFEALKKIMKTMQFNGRDNDLTKNKHIFDGTTEHTDLHFIDDASQHFDFNYFYGPITNDLPVNPKNNKPFIIPFSLSPKYGLTTNYVPTKTDPSTMRRLLYVVYSDYYHQMTHDNDYKETRLIADDFDGKQLLEGNYPEEEWNADINFFIDCCQFYLSAIKKGHKIEPPMGEVMDRIHMAQMGNAFYEWAEVYFSVGSGNCDELISREAALKNFKNISGISTWSTQKFTTALKAYCEYAPHILELNPVQFKNNGGRIVRKWTNDKGEKVATDMIYIRTKDEIDFTKYDDESNDENTQSNAGGATPF